MARVPVAVPDLRLGRFPSDPATRTSLWWYVKALDAHYGVDKFFCLWTAGEILWTASDVRVTAPYGTPCGHRIEACPECSESISREVRGASLRLFLTERGGLGESDVRDLWKLRQVVHGANVFTAARLEMLGRLTPSLQAAVLLLLKAALLWGIRGTRLPRSFPLMARFSVTRCRCSETA